MMTTNRKKINVAKGLKQVGGNRALYNRLVKSFYHDYIDGAERVQQLLKIGDKEAAYRLVHSIKGVAGNLGFLELFEVAKILESCHRSGIADCSEYAPDFFLALDGALQEAEQYKTDDRHVENKNKKAFDKMDVLSTLAELEVLVEQDVVATSACLKDLIILLEGSEYESDGDMCCSLLEEFDIDGFIDHTHMLKKKLGA